MVLSSLPPLLLFSAFLFSLLQTPTVSITKPYIVYLGAHSHGLNPLSVDLDSVRQFHYKFLGSFLRSNKSATDVMFYSYTRHINGFAAILEDEEAAEIAKNPNVISVFLNKGTELQTTRSWSFLGLERNGLIPSDSIWKKARFGEDTILASIDTGVWPESKSFSDEGVGPVPSKWHGTCQHDTKQVHCNRKLIGSRYFNNGLAMYAGPLNSSYSTARDYDGHGSHTLSTAAGGFVPGVSVFGNGNGTAKGGAPQARVAAYKVCWPSFEGVGCFDADVLAAFDAAISDGVDVISISLGGGTEEFFNNAISIGSFHAVKNGIVVVSAAGNSGPDPGTVLNLSPWLLTVGASTTDREFTSYVILGNNKHLKGASLSSKALPSKEIYALISATDARYANASKEEATTCKAGTLDPKKVKGKILVCLREYNNNERTEKSLQAEIAGAAGMILVNDERSGNDVVADPHVLLVSHLNYTDGKHVFDYIKSTKSPVAYITPVKTEMGMKPAPIVAQFSSRGPNPLEQTILKPDIIAPGVSIIAAYTEAAGPTYQSSDTRRVPFNVQTGTSMACPHVSGIAALLKRLHPDWSPAAIKSAIMTTATTQDDSNEAMLDSSFAKATPFAYGAGHIQPNNAMDPGLIYDLTIHDYLNFLCARGYNETMIKSFSDSPYKCPKSSSLADFNYPAIVVANLRADLVTVTTRKLTNVGSPGTYKVRVKAPPEVAVVVKPRSLTFERIGEMRKFKVVFKAKVEGKPRGYSFGELLWSDGNHYVKSPLAAKTLKLTNLSNVT